MARTVTVMVWVPALPPIDATIGISAASATICSIEASNSEMTKLASMAVMRLTTSQGARLRTVRNTLSESSSSPTPPSSLMSSVASSWMTSTMSSTVSTPTSRWLSSTTADFDQVVALEHAGGFFLVLGGFDRDDFAHQGLDLHLALGAQEPVERNGAEHPVARIDDVELEELVRQVLIGAQVVDRLTHRPERRDGDELGLHAPAGGILGKIEAALQAEPLEGRHLREDFLPVLAIHVLEDVDRVVAVERRHAARHIARRQLLDQLRPDRVVDFGQRQVVELVAEHLHELHTLVGIQRLDHVTGVGGVERLHHVGEVVLLLRQEVRAQAVEPVLAEVSIRIAERVGIDAGYPACRDVGFFGHGDPAGLGASGVELV